MATVETSSASLTIAAFSSAPTNTAVSPRKWIEVTGMPTGNGRTWSVMEAMEGAVARIELFHHVVIQLSKPSRIICSGNSRPMKTTRLSRGSPSFHFR